MFDDFEDFNDKFFSSCPTTNEFVHEQDLSVAQQNRSFDFDYQLAKQIEDQLGLNQPSNPMKNAWGNLSYAQLIDIAIRHSQQQRLTLAQIYSWITLYVPYFKDKTDRQTSQGWKNSIRHNLSLHNRFVRIPNEIAGKSSWWTIDLHAKQTKGKHKHRSHFNSNNKHSLTSVRQINRNLYDNFKCSTNQFLLHEMLNSSPTSNEENECHDEISMNRMILTRMNANEILLTPPSLTNQYQFDLDLENLFDVQH